MAVLQILLLHVVCHQKIAVFHVAAVSDGDFLNRCTTAKDSLPSAHSKTIKNFKDYDNELNQHQLHHIRAIQIFYIKKTRLVCLPQVTIVEVCEASQA